MTPLLTACSGFLLAVLWMDLIFDVQVLPHRRCGEVLPEPVLASIAGYYGRATTTSRPMSHLIAVVMLILLGALAFGFIREPSGWLALATVLAVVAIGLAATRTVRNAVQLGGRTGAAAEQTKLAWSVCRDHLVCFACIAALLGLTLVFG